MILAGDSPEPVNLGSSELVSINQLVDIVEGIAGIQLRAQLQPRRAAGRARPQQRQHHDPTGSTAGSRRSSLADGLAETYAWVYDQVKRAIG